MHYERLLGFGGLIVGLVATIAAGVQSWVAWQTRDDFRKSILLSQVMQECADYAAGLAIPQPTPSPQTHIRDVPTIEVLQEYLGRQQRMIWVARLMYPLNPDVAKKLGSQADKEFQEVVEAIESDHKITEEEKQTWALNMALNDKGLQNSCVEFFDYDRKQN